jgi:prepilin-type processing-associated H-X9-DG protein
MEEKKKNKTIRYILVSILVIIILAVTVYIALPRLSCGPIPARDVICKSNLKKLIEMYLLLQKENNQGDLSSNEWERLKKLLEDKSNCFLCPVDKVGPESYAFNENLPSKPDKLPNDLVVIFECAPGYNKVGGPDDVVTDRHGKPGANIAFADGHVEFVTAEDISDLRWTVECDNAAVQAAIKDK